MNRSEKIRIIRTGQSSEKIEYPLFWAINKDGNYIAGSFMLTPKKFEKLNKSQPCFVDELV